MMQSSACTTIAASSVATGVAEAVSAIKTDIIPPMLMSVAPATTYFFIIFPPGCFDKIFVI
jgi:hypothetical protein